MTFLTVEQSCTTCHKNSHCVGANKGCKCNPGYQGNGINCQGTYLSTCYASFPVQMSVGPPLKDLFKVFLTQFLFPCLKLYIATSFAVFHYVSSKVEIFYCSLFGLSIASNVTLPCIMSSP